MARYLISPQALAALDDVSIMDCRFSLVDPALGQHQYHQGHIQGAHYLHLDRDLSASKARHGGRHPLPDPETLAARLRELGVSITRPVVCYDDQRLAFASRAWWLLRWLGHPDVRVLDGGFAAWREAGLAVSAALPDSPCGDFVARPDARRWVDINEVKTVPHRSDAALIDAREAKRFRGDEEPIDPVAGHIAGAVNLPWQDVTDAQGRFRDSNDQAVRWGELLARDELVVYCGSGVTACVNLLALAELGRDDARLYPGSWSDWCSYLMPASR